MRRVAALAAGVLVLAGCGAVTRPAAAPIVPDRPAPPIAAVDEAAPEDVLWFLRLDFGQEPSSDSGTDVVSVSDSEYCFSTSGDTTCPQPTAEQLAEAKAEEQQYVAAITPPPGEEPRVVAKLPLRDGGDELFTVWRNGSGKLCWQTDAVGGDGGGGGGPNGPCLQDARPLAAAPGIEPSCDEQLCLASDGGSTGDGPTQYVLTGTVADDADALRITTADRAVATYPVAGPRIPGTRERVFMLDLGRSDWRTLELVRGGAVTSTAQLPALAAAYEDCDQTIGRPPLGGDQGPDEAALRAYSLRLDTCLRASGALPPGGP
jgi:hypothetical protein